MPELDPKISALLSQQNWKTERKKLRTLILDCGLAEEVKWGKLCYTFQENNVVIIYGLKHYCAIGFFKGALLKDAKGVLHRQGKHSQAMRTIRFASLEEIDKQEPIVKAYIREAIKLEKAGLKVDFQEKDNLAYPEELQQKLDADRAFKTAFDALTPGRRRGYNLYFSAPKQSKTRVSRIEKYAPKILAGKGFRDR